MKNMIFTPPFSLIFSWFLITGASFSPSQTSRSTPGPAPAGAFTPLPD
jgi:hypothetical protein